MDYSKLIGVPYEKMDCWAIVREFYKLTYSIHLPEYYYSRPKDDIESNRHISCAMEDFIKIDTPTFGAIVLIKIKNIPAHVGVCLDTKIFLHTNEKTGCMIDRLDRYKHLIVGYYKYECKNP